MLETLDVRGLEETSTEDSVDLDCGRQNDSGQAIESGIIDQHPCPVVQRVDRTNSRGFPGESRSSRQILMAVSQVEPSLSTTTTKAIRVS